MATFTEDLQPGTVTKCYECRAPVRQAVYRHQCDVRIERECSPGYCFSCIAARGPNGLCNRCRDPYTKLFWPGSLRADEATMWQYKETTAPATPATTANQLIERDSTPTKSSKRLYFYTSLGAYMSAR